MSDSKEIQRTTSNIITSTLTELVQGITGITTSSKEELILSISGLLQKLLAGQRLDAFLKEWKEFVEKGKVKEDYQYSEQHKICLLELLKFLDNDIADEDRFIAIKNIILLSATEKYSKRSDILPQQYIRIVKDLSSCELLILIACYNARKELSWSDNDMPKKQVRHWKAEVLKRTGLVYDELLDIEMEKLLEKRLLLPAEYSDGSGLILLDHFRLTPLAFSLIEFINFYDVEKQS